METPTNANDSNKTTSDDNTKLKQKLKQVLIKLKQALLKNKNYEKEIEALKKQNEEAILGEKEKNNDDGDQLLLYKEKLKDIEKENLKLSNENNQLKWQLKDVQNKYNAINDETKIIKENNNNLIKQNNKDTKEITVLKKKLKQALLKLKTTKNELQQNAYELDSMKSKFAEYKDQSSKSLRIANNKVDNIVLQQGSFVEIRKELEDARAQCDNAIVDLKFANEEKDNLRKELNERIKQTKLLQLKKDDTTTKKKNIELSEKITNLEKEIKDMENENLKKDKKHQQELLKKTENVRKAIFDQEKEALEMKKQFAKMKNDLESEKNKNEKLNLRLEKIQVEYNKQQDETQKEAEEIDVIMNLAKEQASRDSNMEFMKNRIADLESEVIELKRTKNAQNEELVLLQNKKKSREMEENLKLEEIALREKREKDLGEVDSSNNNDNNTIISKDSNNSNSNKLDNDTNTKTNNNVALKTSSTRQATTVEYLKNCLVQFLCSKTLEEQRQLLPVLGTIMHFNKKEKLDARKALELRNQGVSGSLISFVSTFAGVNTGGTTKSNQCSPGPPTW